MRELEDKLELEKTMGRSGKVLDQMEADLEKDRSKLNQESADSMSLPIFTNNFDSTF